MIANKTIICFASGWDFHPTSKHHVMRRLAENNHVIWVNWHASRRPGLNRDDLRNIWLKLRQIQDGPRQVSSNMTVLTPWQIPMPSSAIARRLNASLVRRAIWRVLSQLPPNPVQIWSFAPDIADLVGGFGEELVLYYCVDAFGEFPGYNRAMVEQRELQLLAKSDVVIATSPPLYEAKRQLHPHVHFVQHGVDHRMLAKAVHEELPTPADLAHLPRPIFGFVGVLGDWVDFDLLANLARSKPNASVVLIGPETAGRGACANLPNVHWLGPRNHSLLPAYLRGFDVGLIPFKHVPLTFNANPIKLYEYLAAGVPVVSTSLPAVSPIENSVWLSDDVEGTARCCDLALAHNTSDERRERSKLMIRESWSARLDQIGSAIEQALESQPIRVPMGDAAVVGHSRPTAISLPSASAVKSTASA